MKKMIYICVLFITTSCYMYQYTYYFGERLGTYQYKDDDMTMICELRSIMDNSYFLHPKTTLFGNLIVRNYSMDTLHINYSIKFCHHGFFSSSATELSSSKFVGFYIMPKDSMSMKLKWNIDTRIESKDINDLVLIHYDCLTPRAAKYKCKCLYDTLVPIDINIKEQDSIP